MDNKTDEFQWPTYSDHALPPSSPPLSFSLPPPLSLSLSSPLSLFSFPNYSVPTRGKIPDFISFLSAKRVFFISFLGCSVKTEPTIFGFLSVVVRQLTKIHLDSWRPFWILVKCRPFWITCQLSANSVSCRPFWQIANARRLTKKT